ESAQARHEKLRLVGHSLGGVVAWALAQEYPEAVDTVEVWGAPLRGTGVARFFARISAVQEARFLSPDRGWLQRYHRPVHGLGAQVGPATGRAGPHRRRRPRDAPAAQPPGPARRLT